ARGKRAAVLVDEGGELDRTRPVTGFLVDLARHRLGWRVIHVPPAPRQRPGAIGAFAYQQHLLTAEYPAPDVHLRGGIPMLIRPQGARRADGHLERAGEEQCDQLGELRVALAVEGVARESEPVLRDRLHLAGPLEEVAGRGRAHGLRADCAARVANR